MVSKKKTKNKDLVTCGCGDPIPRSLVDEANSISHTKGEDMEVIYRQEDAVSAQDMREDIIHDLVDRINGKGAKSYGKEIMSDDPRSFKQEAYEEILDFGVYMTAALKRLQRHGGHPLHEVVYETILDVGIKMSGLLKAILIDERKTKR